MPKCGYVAIIGRPNVGKSTLLNHILGQKLSITSHKSQTTRHQILGINTVDDTQYLYVDTPGIHQNYQEKALNRYMNRAAQGAIQFVDVIVWLVDKHWTSAEDNILQMLKANADGVPVILALNKIDLYENREAMLPYLQALSSKYPFKAIIPISAQKRVQITNLEQAIAEDLPAREHLFEADELTDKSSRFLAAEIIREKLIRFLGEELPYQTTVEIDLFEQDGQLLDIAATIFVERKSQKIIIIGKQGQKLKQIGQEARIDLEKFFQTKVFLQLWVKVKTGWSDDDRALRSLGYKD